MSQGCAGLCCQDMIEGQAYTFHFKYSGWLQVALDTDTATKALQGDSNFAGPSVTVNTGGLLKDGSVAVSFTYAGKGSLVGQAGQEMQNVLNSVWVTGIGTSLVFSGAETGVAACCGDGTGDTNWLMWAIVAGIILIVAAPYILELEVVKSLRGAR